VEIKIEFTSLATSQLSVSRINGSIVEWGRQCGSVSEVGGDVLISGD